MPANQELLNQGRYRVVHPLPSVENSSAFNAYDTIGNVNVVLKEFGSEHPVLSGVGNNQTVGSFAGKAERLKVLRHDNILKVEDYFSDNGSQFLVLESVPGRSLQDHLEELKGPMDLSKAFEWTEQIAAAAAFLSAQGQSFVHGNITPSNVFVTSFGQLKLSSVGVREGSDPVLDTSVNSGGEGGSKISFMPLEIIWESLDPASQKVISNSYDETAEATLLSPADERSDVYSIGAILYAFLTGHEPLDALERSIEMLEAKPDPIQDPAGFNKALPRQVADMVLKALEVRRENRYGSIAELISELREAQADIAKAASATGQASSEPAKQAPTTVSVNNDEVQRVLEAKKKEFEAEKRRQEELLKEKLRLAEEQRKIAEQRAAEAERLLKQQQQAQAKPAVTSGDDLLEMPETMSGRSTAADLPEVSAGAIEAFEEDPIHLSVSAVIPDVQPNTPEVEIVDRSELEHESDDVEMFAETRRGFPMFAIVGVAAVLVVAVIGIVFMVSRSGAEPTVQTALPAANTAPVESLPVAVESPAEQAAPENAFLDQPPAADAAAGTQSPAATPTPERRKTPAPTPTAAKPAAPKKVTVDDLINDN